MMGSVTKKEVSGVTTAVDVLKLISNNIQIILVQLRNNSHLCCEVTLYMGWWLWKRLTGFPQRRSAYQPDY